MTAGDRGGPMMEHDAEAIARVLDGKASAEERARILAEADRSPELLALLADSAAAMNVESPAAAITSLESRRRWRIRRAGWMGLAAAGIVAIALPAVLKRNATIPEVPLAMLGGARTLEQARMGPALPGIRRGESVASRGAQSARIGARLVDYESVKADTSATTIAIELAAALRAIAGGSVVALNFDAGKPVTPEVVAAIEQVVDVKSFRSAMWAEAMRLGAAAGDSTLIVSPEARTALGSIASDGSLPEAAQKAAAEMRTIVGEKPIGWEALRVQAAALVASLMSR